MQISKKASCCKLRSGAFHNYYFVASTVTDSDLSGKIGINFANSTAFVSASIAQLIQSSFRSQLVDSWALDSFFRALEPSIASQTQTNWTAWPTSSSPPSNFRSLTGKTAPWPAILSSGYLDRTWVRCLTFDWTFSADQSAANKPTAHLKKTTSHSTTLESIWKQYVQTLNISAALNGTHSLSSILVEPVISSPRTYSSYLRAVSKSWFQPHSTNLLLIIFMWPIISAAKMCAIPIHWFACVKLLFGVYDPARDLTIYFHTTKSRSAFALTSLLNFEFTPHDLACFQRVTARI